MIQRQAEPMPIDNGGARRCQKPSTEREGQKQEKTLQNALSRQRGPDSGGNWRRFRSVSTFDICQIVRGEGIAGGEVRLIREPPPPLDRCRPQPQTFP